MWDMDGTLIDSQPLWDAAFTRLCEERGGTVSRAVLAALVGASEPGTRALIAATGAASSAEDPAAYEITDAMNAEVGDLVVAQPPLVDGAARITAELARRGVVQAIVSASRRRLVEAVAGSLDGAGTVLVTGEDGLAPKPSHEPYSTGVERVGVPASRCVVVEDSSNGLASARAAGLRTIQLGTTPLLPDDRGVRLVRSLRDLTPAVLGVA
ncbi:HAD family hydrolase [Actinomyces radicidentis]|uniref:HAD family hydrolase n=1 Tax=Actinomyces radicidentis TaxID=111015 RepID=UPI0021501BC8|nr:HAD family phosphatase [Actinomyces radicidentis]